MKHLRSALEYITWRELNLFYLYLRWVRYIARVKVRNKILLWQPLSIFYHRATFKHCYLITNRYCSFGLGGNWPCSQFRMVLNHHFQCLTIPRYSFLILLSSSTVPCTPGLNLFTSFSVFLYFFFVFCLIDS